jgi:hypothetical protein
MDEESDCRFEISAVVGGEAVGWAAGGELLISPGVWFDDSLTHFIVWIADLYPWITVRPKPDMAWIAERMKMTVAWNEMYGLEGSGGGFKKRVVS